MHINSSGSSSHAYISPRPTSKQSQPAELTSTKDDGDEAQSDPTSTAIPTATTTEVTQTDVHAPLITTATTRATPTRTASNLGKPSTPVRPIPFSDPLAAGLPPLTDHQDAVQKANRGKQQQKVKATEAHVDALQQMATAIEANSPKKVLAVLMRSTLLNEHLENGETPLQFAVGAKKGKVVLSLVSHPDIEINKPGRDGKTPLHEAVSANDTPLLELLLKHPKIRLNSATPLGVTPYLLAIERGHIKLAQILLERGADANLTMNDGFGAVHVACREGSLKMLQWLLKQPSTFQRNGELLPLSTVLNRATPEGWTPFLLAAKAGTKDLVAFFLNHPEVNKEPVNSSGDGPLHVSIKAGRTEVVDMLTDSGADLAATNGEGATPFLLAVQHWAGELPARLLPQLLDKEVYINQPTKSGLKPLHAACLNGDVRTVKWLLAQPATLQGRNKQLKLVTVLNQVTADGKTPLRLAVEAKQPRLVRLLLEQGARPNKEDHLGDTPLHVAVRAGNKAIVSELLLHKNINVNAENRHGEIPFLAAVANNDIEMQEMLFARGANIHHTDQNGTTALHLACEKHRLNSVQWLLQQPEILTINGKTRTMADVLNQRDHLGNTLMLCAIHESEDAHELVEFLIEQPGVDLNLGDVDGHTSLHMACALGLVDIARLLADKGADMDRADTNGATPLHLAAEEGEFAAVNWLLEQLAMPKPDGQLRDMKHLLNQTTNEGYTPLHLAAEDNCAEVVNILLEHPEVDLHAVTPDGETALQLAKRVGADDVVDLLEQLDDAQ